MEVLNRWWGKEDFFVHIYLVKTRDTFVCSYYKKKKKNLVPTQYY